MGRNLTAAGQPTPRPTIVNPDGPNQIFYQAHHIIVGSAVDGKQTVQRNLEEAYRNIPRGDGRDFRINDAWNGIWLPTTPADSSSRNLALHNSFNGLGDIHNNGDNNYTDVVQGGVRELVGLHHTRLDRALERINNNRNMDREDRETLERRTKTSFAETVARILERKAKDNLEEFLTGPRSRILLPSEKEIFLNLADRCLRRIICWRLAFRQRSMMSF